MLEYSTCKLSLYFDIYSIQSHSGLSYNVPRLPILIHNSMIVLTHCIIHFVIHYYFDVATFFWVHVYMFNVYRICKRRPCKIVTVLRQSNNLFIQTKDSIDVQTYIAFSSTLFFNTHHMSNAHIRIHSYTLMHS
jgi:hypothetical protein